jgi:GNAT superfamily N-acetyltransferase
MAVTMRRADPAECPTLSDLALRSKGSWGYDDRFLEACRAELTVDPADVEREWVAVAEDDGRMLGFYGLGGAPPQGELLFLFVEPDSIGSGTGRALWRDCLTTAAHAGFSRIRIESDPNACGFYLAMGATPVGEAPSRSITGRSLPVLSLDVDGAG